MPDQSKLSLAAGLSRAADNANNNADWKSEYHLFQSGFVHNDINISDIDLSGYVHNENI